MDRQKDFNKLFLEKNKEIDKVIEEYWKPLVFSDYMRNLYKEKTGNIFSLNLGYRRIRFYQKEKNRYVLEMSNGEGGKHVFYICFEDDTTNYELHDFSSKSYTNNEALCNLTDNKARIKYLKRKVGFLEWSKEYKYGLYEVLEELTNVDEDIKELEGIKW